MKCRHSHRTSCLPGASLVVVVSLVAMLTVLAVALLLVVNQSTQGYANEVASRQGEALAKTAFETLLADLTDEMEKGSAAVKVNQLADGGTYRQYDLTGKRAGMRVSASLRPTAPATGVLAKQTQADKPFHSRGPAPPVTRSSKVSTASGKSPFAPSSWNGPKLLGAAESFTADNAPMWVYVSRNGVNPKEFAEKLRQSRDAAGLPNPDFVVGRYGYNLYDTSGLLDINVAGFPSTEGPDAARVGEKGSQLFADLRMLPGMTVESTDVLARWKHKWEKDAKVNEDYVRRSEGAGWRKMFANDNVFLNRQDLLSFWESSILPREALPHLTHFSRDLDAPSWRPDPKRPRVKFSAVEGGNDAFGSDDLINPDPQVFNAARQGPIVNRRFPLDRLKYVATPKGKDGPDEEAIDKAAKYFGLRWEAGEGVWVYVHPRPNGSISTLANVPPEREPNFFELLKSAILTGSLGRQYSPTDIAGGYYLATSTRSQDALVRSSKYFMDYGNKASLDAATDLQILQIGANIIDQADEDSFPTTIRFNKPSSAPPPATPFYVSGKEDVPYAVMTRVIAHRGKKLPQVVVYDHDWFTGAYSVAPGSEAYEVNFALQVRLWRPHQPVDDEEYDGPVNFRIRPEHADLLGGGSKIWTCSGWSMPGDIPYYEVRHNPGSGHPDTWTQFPYQNPVPASVPCSRCGATLSTTNARLVPPDRSANFNSSQNNNAPNSPQANGNYTYWRGPDYAADGRPKVFDGSEQIVVRIPHDSRAFREPQSVHSAEHGSVAGYYPSGSIVETRDGDFPRPGLPGSYTSIAGFRLGRGVTARVSTTEERAGLTRRMLELRLGLMHFRSGPIDIIMEYQVPETGQWRLYQRTEFVFATQNGGSGINCFDQVPDKWDKDADVFSSYLVDPRTPMWGGVPNHETVGSTWNRSHEGQTGRYEKGRWLAGDTTVSTGTRTAISHPQYSSTFNVYYGWNIWNWNGSGYVNPGNGRQKQSHAVVENDEVLWEPGDRRRQNFSYKDPDDVLRYGVAAVNEYDRGQFLGNPMVSRHTIGPSGGLSRNEPMVGRPRILNRPFRSVGELGYVFRGTPWRDLEFLHPTSPDAALLDLFCLHEETDEEDNPVEDTPVAHGSSVRRVEPPVVAGRVNLNSAGPEVIAALLMGAERGTAEEPNPIKAEEARLLASTMVAAVRGQSASAGFQPMLSKAELVAQPKSAGDGTAVGMIKLLSDKFDKPEDRSVKDSRQAVTRALADGTTVRAWTFLLDLVVQAGRLPPGAATLEDFTAAAERRYWVHFSMDRLTGKLLDVQWERVAQ